MFICCLIYPRCHDEEIEGTKERTRELKSQRINNWRNQRTNKIENEPTRSNEPKKKKRRIQETKPVKDQKPKNQEPKKLKWQTIEPKFCLHKNQNTPANRFSRTVKILWKCDVQINAPARVLQQWNVLFFSLWALFKHPEIILDSVSCLDSGSCEEKKPWRSKNSLH